MSKMLERVAQAIKERTLESDNEAIEGLPMEDARRCARAAIEAMREPTDEMIKASLNRPALCEVYSGQGNVLCWQSMIDEALK